MTDVQELRQNRIGMMFVMDAPSGTGKTTVLKTVLKDDPNLKFSVSATTRAPREGEKNGVDYYFISNEEYDKLKEENAFYEYVDSTYGPRYGTLKSEVDTSLAKGKDVVFDIDYVGLRQLKKNAGDKIVSVLLLPPSVKEVRERLINRGTDSIETIEKRMSVIDDKLSKYQEFDYIIINDDLEQTIQKVKTIIASERLKRIRYNSMSDFISGLIAEED